MDNNRGQRRPNDTTLHAASNPAYQQALRDPLQHHQQQRRTYANPSGERYRPASINTSPSGAVRGMGASAGYSGYYPEPAATGFGPTSMPQGAMGYHPSTDFGQADARQTQSFAGSYNPTAMMYNVPQAAGAQSAAVYDTSQQFPSRQPAALQMMTTDVAAPYFSSEPTNTAGQATSSSASQVYQQAGLQSYSAGGGMAAMGGMATQPAAPTQADVSMEEEYPVPADLEQTYTSFLSELNVVFQQIRSGKLSPASESLLHISGWLLTNVAELGLNSDNVDLYERRMKMWNDFNHAWLTMFQRQKDMMESGQPIHRPHSLISQEGLEKMGKELLRLCDGVERYGLVDYQYGVWEEQIIAILVECLDIYENANESSGNGSVSGSSRN
ncbi:hypothetical protein QBC46DRAFT_341173 [Diplogelasinospora grovesii]|uniref:Uncharacterized protein n=1 Tax=Diplogelasinospora grovesii TaxID=303347 RepID=A0AAN6S4H7_9PEZI|nr:hypothetical protein QBC46DRAFT_341173 [Diplogelasinospora grovesii]